MPELRIKEVRLPELHLPHMSRDDIDRVIDDARDQISEIEMPDLSKIELPKFDLSKIDVPKAVAGAAFIGRAAPRARWPFVLGGLVGVAALTAVVLSQPPVRARLQELARTAKMRIDERRAEMETQRQEAHAFDAAVAVPVQPSAYADDAPLNGSPLDGSSELPDGFGADQASLAPAKDATRV